MTNFIDLHTHILCGADDGARDIEEMIEMLRAAYNDGTRIICLTPHFKPGYYSNTPDMDSLYEKVIKYSAGEMPDLKIFRGNEMFYHSDCIQNLISGNCLTLASSIYVLIEFDPAEEYVSMLRGLSQLITGGYVPLLAHVERYECLVNKKKRVKEIVERGVLIQSNAEALMKGYGRGAARFVDSLIKKRLVHVISSDAHGVDDRPPVLKKSYDYVLKRYGGDIAYDLFYGNAINIILNRKDKKWELMN